MNISLKVYIVSLKVTMGYEICIEGSKLGHAVTKLFIYIFFKSNNEKQINKNYTNNLIMLLLTASS